VVIEHNMDFVMDLCHRIMVMVEGQVLAIGTPGRDPRQQAGARRLPGELTMSDTMH
jgi:ABC-type branched-subunit amino acid transport system ATPase component